MAEEEENIFKDKVEDVDWQLVLEKQEQGLLDRLIEADKASDQSAIEKLVDEAEGLFSKLATFKVDKDDTKAQDVDNLIHLFQMAQTVMEIKNYKLEVEEESHTETKDKLKELKRESKEMRERIKEQDNEIDELQAEAMKSATTPAKGKAGSLDPAAQRRMDAELNSTKKNLEVAQEELTQAKRSLEAEKERMRDVQSNASKWEEENNKLKNDLNNLTKELENTNRRNAEEEKRQQKIRAQAQKTTKEAYKFVKEISELSRRNEELETELKNKEQELMAVADDIISLRQELENKSALLDTTAHAKEELDEEVNSLRERVTEFTVREDEREEEHEVFMQDITKRVRSLKEDAAAKASELEMVNKELREAKATIEQMEEDKQASAGERRLAELQAEITQLHDEKSESLEQYMEMQRENKKCKQQLLLMEAEEKKVLKRLHVQYKARENELRAGFFEKQDEMADAERRNVEMSNRTAELQDTVMELEQHITQLENGTFGLSEAMDRVKELKRDVEVGNNKISIRTKELNEALRKIEDLHEEVRLLRDHLRRNDPELKFIGQSVGFNSVADADKNSELEWTGLKDGFRLDISGYKVRTAMELEKSRAMILQLEREVESLETERLEMKAQLRLLSLQRGERAAKLGMSASDIEKLDSYAEQLKGGIDAPIVETGPSAGDKNKVRKLQERGDRLEKQLKDKDKELGTALETIDKLKEDMRAASGVKDAIDEVRRMQENMASNYQAQMYAQQAAREADPARPSKRGGDDGDKPAAPAPVPMMPMMGPSVMEQIAKAIRDGDIGDQASVEVMVANCKNLPSTGSYVQASVERENKLSAKVTGTSSPTFNETLKVPVLQRKSDMLTISVFATSKDVRPNPEEDKLLGKVEIQIASFGRASDDTWTGSRQATVDLLDESGKPVYAEGTRNKATIEVKLKFVEGASKRAQVLEVQLESVRSLQTVTEERLKSREHELESLRADLDRKSEDLTHVVAERNRMRDELHRARMNSGMSMGGAGMAMPGMGMMQAPVGGGSAGMGGGGGGGGAGGMSAVASEHSQSQPSGMQGAGGGASGGNIEQQQQAGQNLQQSYAMAMQQIGDLNAFLIQTLDDLSKREEELQAMKGEVERYKEDFGVMRMQQVLLYKEHATTVGDLEKEKTRLVKQWEAEKNRADAASSKASAAMLRLEAIDGASPDSVQAMLREAESRAIILQADQDVFERIVRTKKEEEAELRARYDSLVVEMAKQEHRLKERVGRLDRQRRAAEVRLADSQRILAQSVPREELSQLRQEYLLLKEKYSTVMNEESKALLERATVEGHKQRAVKLTKENEDLRLKLAEAADKALVLTSRLEGLATGDGTPEQQQLAALSAKLVKLEVSERNSARRAELALERLRAAEKDVDRLQDRILSLEEESVENVTRKHELEESDRELRNRLEGCVSAEDAEALRNQLSKQESEIMELQIRATEKAEIADLATEQARAMEQLHAVHSDELEAIRKFLIQVQSESDELAEAGIMQAKLLDRDRQIHQLTSKIAGMDRELVRMDDYVVRLEDSLERKNEQLFESGEHSSEKIKRLEKQLEQLKIKSAGQIPLEKADQWAVSLRDLTAQKQSALEDLSGARKRMQEAEERAETLQIRFDDQAVIVRALKEEMGSIKGGHGEAAAERINTQIGDMTRLKVDNLRYARQIKQLQEREAFLEGNCQQLERDIRRLEEQLVAVQSESESKAQEAAEAKMAGLRQKVSDLEGQLAAAPTAAAPRSAQKKTQGTAYTPPAIVQMETRMMDYTAIAAMKEEVEKLGTMLQDKEDEIEMLHKQLEEQAKGGQAAAKGVRMSTEGFESGANEAAQHTEEVARLTIERLEKNNRRKNEMVSKYQEQIRQARQEYIAQKELDNSIIEELRNDLAKKTQEAIGNLRSRAEQTQYTPQLTGSVAADADAVFAEKDSLIQALNGELQQLKGKTVDLERQVSDLEVKVADKERELSTVRSELRKAEERKPSQVLETLVFKLKKQLAEKERKQNDLQGAIKDLRNEMHKAAENQAAQQAATLAALSGPSGGDVDAQVSEQATKLRTQVEGLESKLNARKGELTKAKKELEDERAAKASVTKEKEGLEERLRRQLLDLKKANREKAAAVAAEKEAVESAKEDQKRISELERKIREMGRTAGPVPASGRRGEEATSGKEEAVARWEAEKRLEMKVDRLSNKLRDQRRELEAIEKQRESDAEKAEKEAERLRGQIVGLREDNSKLKARLRGDGDHVDSEEVLTRVREAEKRVRDLEEQNEKMRQAIEVDGREREHILKVKVAELQKKAKELADDKESLSSQLLAAEDAQSYEKEKVREVRRLEGELARLKEREDQIEADLLASQNQVLRLRFESEASALKIQRWQRRVRELESLPLAVGKAGAVGAGARKGGKDDDETERFVRSTKVAMEKLHRENEALRANSGSNVKYMDVVREAKNLKAAVGERDREIASLSEKLASLKEASDRKAKVDEKNRSLERQLKAEREKHDEASARLKERDRQVMRLESDLRAARETGGRGGGSEVAASDALAEADALSAKLRAAERQAVSAEASLKETQRDLRAAERRVEELVAEQQARVHLTPSGASASHGGGAGADGELRKAREIAKKLQEENEDLRAELNSFDPAFFDEIEDLKYNHNEMVKLVDRYETLLQHLSSRYGFDFSPAAPARRSRA